MKPVHPIEPPSPPGPRGLVVASVLLGLVVIALVVLHVTIPTP